MTRILLFLFLVSIIFPSCHFFGKRIKGSGTVTTQAHQVSGYNSVDVSGAIDVYIKQENASQVNVITDDNLQEHIEIREVGGVLKIDVKGNKNLRPTKGIKVYVSAPEFRSLEASGSCDIYSESLISNTESIGIDLSGSSDAKLDLNSPRVTAKLTGAGSITLKGQTKDMELKGTGSSDLNCFEMQAENVKVNITGSGDAEVSASVKLDVNVTGAGSVKYKGGASVSQKVSGSGSVKKVE